MTEAPLPPAIEALAVLRRVAVREADWALPLYALLVARQPLTPEEWSLVPSPCPGLGASLPAVLARGGVEAALLVARLPPADAQRLRTLALCLARAARQGALPALPTPILSRLLALSVA